jgi:hypothetical protein
MGWDWQCSLQTTPDAVAWQELVVAVVTRWTVAIGTRTADAEPQGGSPSRMRQAPPTNGAPAALACKRHGAAGYQPALVGGYNNSAGC